MSLKLENTAINKLYLGSNEIKKAYLGNTLVFDNTVVVDNRFIFTVKTDNPGTSGTNQFLIKTAYNSYNYNVETSDGYVTTGITGDHTITFPSGIGTHTVYISGLFPMIRFGGSFDKDKILSIENWGIYGIGSTSQDQAFRRCFNIVNNAIDEPDFSTVTNYGFAFQQCTDWQIVPNSDYSNISGTFAYAWFACDLLSFPAVSLASGTDFNNAWRSNTNLVDFPPNVFDGSSATNFSNAFALTNLSQTSIDNILVSIESNGTSNGAFTQSLGNSPSIIGQTAIDNLRSRGWTVTVTGGY